MKRTNSWIMLIPPLLSILTTSTFMTHTATGTIYIRADGHIDPPTAPIISDDKFVYKMTNEFNGSIVIERDNIVLDGAGHLLMGTEDMDTGITLYNGKNVTIKNFEIRNFNVGVMFENCSNNTLYLNKFTENTVCVELKHSSENSILFNNLANFTKGILLSNSSNNNILENIIHGTEDSEGIFLRDASNNNIISKNELTNNGHAIFLWGYSNVISRNNLTANLEGIGLYASIYNDIFENNIVNCTWLVFLIRDSYGNRIFHNNVIQNQNPQFGTVITIESHNIWDDDYPSGGNFWSSYNGADADGDGIGDIPYVIDADNQDRYPLIAPYTEDFNSVDKTPPIIVILSPENRQYAENSVQLIFTISEPTSWIGYSLDSQANITIAGNITLTVLLDGPHNLTVYAADTNGNIGVSQTVYFSINSQQSTQKWVVVAFVAFVVGGFAILLLHRKRSMRKLKPKTS